jgi:hypothetical protein
MNAQSTLDASSATLPPDCYAPGRKLCPIRADPGGGRAVGAKGLAGGRCLGSRSMNCGMAGAHGSCGWVLQPLLRSSSERTGSLDEVSITLRSTPGLKGEGRCLSRGRWIGMRWWNCWMGRIGSCRTSEGHAVHDQGGLDLRQAARRRWRCASSGWPRCARCVVRTVSCVGHAAPCSGSHYPRVPPALSPAGWRFADRENEVSATKPSLRQLFASPARSSREHTEGMDRHVPDQ